METGQVAAERTIGQAIGEIRAERMRFVLMRFSFVVLTLLHLAILTWLVLCWPLHLLAFGSTAADGLVLLALTYLASAAFLIHWGASFRDESLSEFLRVLFGAHQLIRGRQQFCARLAAECRRVRRDRRYVFSLFVIQHQPIEIADRHWDLPVEDACGALVRSIVRGEDIVGVPSNDEVWVLAERVDHRTCANIAGRLASALRDSEPPFDAAQFRIGASTAGMEDPTPNALLNAARSRLAPV